MKERKLGLIGRKLGMLSIFNDKNESIPVTVLELGPCVVLAKRTLARDGYNALQLGFGEKSTEKVNKPEAGQLRALPGGLEKAREHVVELRVSEKTLGKFELGTDISLKDLGLKVGDLIDVTGTSKGKGFQGVVRRYSFKGFNSSHGTHEYFRHGGSIGCRKWPGRVFKGRKMPGHMGDLRVTTQNLTIAQVREDDNVLLVHGAVPGHKNGNITVRPAIKFNHNAD